MTPPGRMTDSPLSTDLDAHRVPGATLPALLEARARRSPGAEGLRFEGRSLTFGQMWEHALSMARDLGELGVRRGQRVAVIVHNGLDFPLAWLAIPMLRAVVVPVHAGYRGNDLRHVLEASRASIVLAGAEQLPLLEEIRPGLARVRGTCALADGRIDG
ncbi:MAG TPA: class I adenylate-forming enzyme family protein, partial [Longimicrobiales bacterium]|nr:class I adenylate-forming enzyme family protein [Longimicrobiales bacterium]